MKGLLLIFLCFVIATCSFAQWAQTNGPSGGNIDEIIKLKNYLFVNGEAGGIFRSDNEGESWVAVNQGLPKYPHCYAFTHYDTLLYASIYGAGIFYSSNFGETWNPINTGIENSVSYQLLVHEDRIWAGYSQGGLFYSSDHGTTWTLLPGPVEGAQLSCLTMINEIIVGAAASRVFTSSDNGQNWTEIHSFSSPNNIEAFDNSVFALGSNTSVFISENNGASWAGSAPIADMSEIIFAKSIYAEGDSIYLGVGVGKILISYDKGLSWAMHQSAEIYNYHNDILEDQGSLYLSTTDGFYRSSDTAKTWSGKNEGLINGIIGNISVEGNTVMAGGYSGFYQSLDNGDSWAKQKPANEALINVHGVHLYGYNRVMATDRVVYRSVNNGPWQGTLLLGSSSISTMSGNKGQLITSVRGHGLYISDDGGSTWDFVTNDLITQGDITSSYINGDTLIVGGYNTLLISEDRGENWRSAPPNPTYFVASSYQMYNNKLYVASNNNIYSSADMGISEWERQSTNRSSNINTLLVLRDTVFLAATDGANGEAIILSYDSGKTWYDSATELQNITAVALNDDYIFASTYGKGVWKMPLDKLNVPPVIVDLKEELTIRQGESIVLSNEDFNIVDPDGGPFTVSVADGNNFSVTEGNTLAADPEFFGTLTATVTVNDGFSDSRPFEISVEVIENVKPVITGTEGEFIIEKNGSITVSLANVNVVDPDDTAITLRILPGQNYTVSNEEVVPAAEFIGDLDVSVVANDGFQDSEIFELTIKVVELITEIEQTPNKFSVYPSPAERVLVIESRTNTIHSFDLCDVMGRRLIEQRPLYQGKNEIDVQLIPSGVYFLKVAGNKAIRVIKR